MNADVFRSAAYCAAIGDALGVPWEFQNPQQLPPKAFIEMAAPAGYRRSHAGTPEGTWSDDTAMMLALADSLASARPFSEDDFARRLINWYTAGSYTPDGRVFDIGIQTRAALDGIIAGVPAIQAGLKGEHDNGCGSLIRALPVAFTNLPSDGLIELSMDQSSTTHGHDRSKLSCAIYVLLVHALAAGMRPQEALQIAREELGYWVRAQTELRTQAAPFNPTSKRLQVEFELIWGHLDQNRVRLGSGYVLDTLWSAWTAFTTTHDVESCLREAVSYGHDTDSVACVAGGLAGACYGLAAIPERWLGALHGRAMLDGFVDALLQAQDSGGFP